MSEDLEIAVRKEGNVYEWTVDVVREDGSSDTGFEAENIDAGQCNDPVETGRLIGEAVSRYLSAKG